MAWSGAEFGGRLWQIGRAVAVHVKLDEQELRWSRVRLDLSGQNLGDEQCRGRAIGPVPMWWAGEGPLAREGLH